MEQAGTVELASNAYDEQLLWLMLDPNQRTRTETVFRDRLIPAQSAVVLVVVRLHNIPSTPNLLAKR